MTDLDGQQDTGGSPVGVETLRQGKHWQGEQSVNVFLVESGASAPETQATDGKGTLLITQSAQESLLEFKERVHRRLTRSRICVAAITLLTGPSTSRGALRSRLPLAELMLQLAKEQIASDVTLTLSGDLSETKCGQHELWLIAEALLPKLPSAVCLKVVFNDRPRRGGFRQFAMH